MKLTTKMNVLDDGWLPYYSSILLITLSSGGRNEATGIGRKTLVHYVEDKL